MVQRYDGGSAKTIDARDLRFLVAFGSARGPPPPDADPQPPPPPIHRAMQYTPGRRSQAPEEFADHLERPLLPLAATPAPPPAPPAPRPPRRRRLLALAVGAAALLLLTVALARLGPPRGDN